MFLRSVLGHKKGETVLILPFNLTWCNDELQICWSGLWAYGCNDSVLLKVTTIPCPFFSQFCVGSPPLRRVNNTIRFSTPESTKNGLEPTQPVHKVLDPASSEMCYFADLELANEETANRAATHRSDKNIGQKCVGHNAYTYTKSEFPDKHSFESGYKY